MVSELGVLPAKTELIVPVLVTRIASESSPANGQSVVDEAALQAAVQALSPDDLAALAGALSGAGETPGGDLTALFAQMARSAPIGRRRVTTWVTVWVALHVPLLVGVWLLRALGGTLPA